MKKIGLSCTAIVTVMFGGAASAALSDSDAKQLMTKYNCQACHAVDKKLVGPAYKDVAKKYENDKDALPRLAKKVREGGVGVWGQIPMPANTQVNEAESLQLVKWVLSLK